MAAACAILSAAALSHYTQSDFTAVDCTLGIDHYLAALVGSRIVLAAGRDSPKSSDPALSIHHTTAPVEVFDLDELPGGAWREGAAIPTPRAGNGLAVDAASGRVIVVGGETDHNNQMAGGVPAVCTEASAVPSVSQARALAQRPPSLPLAASA